jgi:hypothetical protein
MTRTYLDNEWGIVSLTDGTLLAGYIHLEHDALRHDALEVDVPAVPGAPANIAVFDPADLLLARGCSRAEAVAFAANHAWPEGDGMLSPRFGVDPDADRGVQGAD